MHIKLVAFLTPDQAMNARRSNRVSPERADPDLGTIVHGVSVEDHRETPPGRVVGLEQHDARTSEDRARGQIDVMGEGLLSNGYAAKAAAAPLATVRMPSMTKMKAIGPSSTFQGAPPARPPLRTSGKLPAN